MNVRTLATDLVLPSPFQPMAVARHLVEQLFVESAGLVLRSYRGDFCHWTGTHYIDVNHGDVRAQAYAFVEHAVYVHPEKGPQPFAPTRKKMGDLMEALDAVVHVASRDDAPLWIDHRTRPNVADVIAMTNGLLEVRSRTLHSHTPLFFNHHALPFAFDPKATAAPTWVRFLHDLWPDDEDAIATLQEVMGYLLAGGTNQQKAFMVVGPKRGGKGTLGRVMTGLLGPHNVAAPTLASLATNFGLSPLIGKPLALISDARLSTRADSKIVVERLLSISGEDSLTIDRKYRDPWTGRLPTRFLILSNELPKLSDASGALASRFVLLVLQRSFYGHENPHLTGALLAEAPAIFNWALEGLDRLLARGYFVNPASGAEAIQQMEDLSSPIGAFVRDRCLVRRDLSVDREALWTAWKSWCTGTNTRLGTKAILGRDLHAAVPTLKVVRPRQDGDRVYRYDGVGLCDQYIALLPGPLGPSGPTDGLSGPSGPSGPSDSAMYPPQESAVPFDGDPFGRPDPGERSGTSDPSTAPGNETGKDDDRF
jgi:putative DNA primase/helicase